LPILTEATKGVRATEQLNIEGKRSGEGFIAHKATLIQALSRALAERVTVLDVTVGRRGLLGYIKSLGGSNVVKIVPSSGSASGERASDKRLKVVCGANTGYLADNEWVKEANTKGKSARGGTPFTFCEVRVSPKNTVKPNLGSIELAEALAKTLPFTASDDKRPVLQGVKFEAKEGKLRLVSADGYVLAVISLDYDGEGEALISRDNLKGMVNALKRARRISLGFANGGEQLDSKSLILDTELIRYKWQSLDGSYPDYDKLIPSESKASVHFDTTEAAKALSSLRALADSRAYSIDLTIGNGKLIMANTDDKGQAEINADTEGEGKIRIDGKYFASVLRACGGMVELKMQNAFSPMLFSVDGYRVVVMPMMSNEAKAQQAEAQPKAEVVTEAEKIAEAAEAKAEVVTEKPKRKGKGKAKGTTDIDPSTEIVTESDLVAVT
jgi:DNA polymerase-3 subunit beta